MFTYLLFLQIKSFAGYDHISSMINILIHTQNRHIPPDSYNFTLVFNDILSFRILRNLRITMSTLFLSLVDCHRQEKRTQSRP